jgi:hypothetical protein
LGSPWDVYEVSGESACCMSSLNMARVSVLSLEYALRWEYSEDFRITFLCRGHEHTIVVVIPLSQSVILRDEFTVSLRHYTMASVINRQWQWQEKHDIKSEPPCQIHFQSVSCGSGKSCSALMTTIVWTIEALTLSKPMIEVAHLHGPPYHSQGLRGET